jgi:hypothetical protein
MEAHSFSEMIFHLTSPARCVRFGSLFMQFFAMPIRTSSTA